MFRFLPAVPVVLCGSFLGSFFAEGKEKGIFRSLVLKFIPQEKLKAQKKWLGGEIY